MQHFVTFKKYTDAALARETQQLLQDNGIISRLADNNASVDSNFGKEAFADYEVQLDPADFERAEMLLESQAEGLMNNLPEDYYLLTFSDEELYEVIVKKEEWSDFDYVLAKKLLTNRGSTIDEDELKRNQREHLESLAKPEDIGIGWIVCSYVFAFLGGLLGILGGVLIYTAKKTLPDGRRVYTYNDSNRKNAFKIIIVSVVVLFILITYRFFKD